MAVLVIAAHGKTPAPELPRQRVVAAYMLAQAMHQQHGAALGLARRQRPVLDGQVLTVAGGEGGQGGGNGFGHRTRRQK